MESKHERKTAEHKGHEKKVHAGKMAHRGGSPKGVGGLHEGRKAYDEARGHPSRERHARDAKEAPTVPKEKRKAMGKMAGKGEMTHMARKVEHVHYHVKGPPPAKRKREDHK